MALKGHDFGAGKLKVTTTPMFFIQGDKMPSPTPPDYFPNSVHRALVMALKGHDFGADKLKVITTPMFFIQGDKTPSRTHP